MPRVAHVGRVALHYIDCGQGQPIVLMHGGIGDFDSWAPYLPYFKSSYRVLSYSRRYNYPNQNRSIGDAYSCFVDAEDLAGFLRQIEPRRPHIVASSYGALVALAFAIDYPGLLRSIVLVEPPLHAWLRNMPCGKAAYREFMESIWQPAGQAFDIDDARGAMRVLFDGFAGRSLFDTLSRTQLLRVMRNASAMASLTASKEPFPNLPLANVKRLKMPVLLVRGAHTTTVHRLAMDALRDALPEAGYATIPRAGHACAHENRSEFRRVVAAFLKRVTSAPCESRRRA